MKKMKLYVYVHELYLEIGHSNAMIETINQFPENSIEEINIISYECGDLDKLFPNVNCNKNFIKVPFKGLYPFLFKMLFFHFYTFFYTFFFVPKDAKKIGIGIASLSARYINVQFIHYHWDEFYFDLQKLTGVPYLYKKMLFFFFKRGEDYLYSRSDVKLSILSKFETSYCKEKFSLRDNQVKTVYSGVNLDKFKISPLGRNELYKDLLATHKELEVIDINRPIFLFVGAYERKGLAFVFKALMKLDNPQIVVVGSPEAKTTLKFPEGLTIAKIHFSKQIEKFYSLCDTFVFPSIYEPFGLVILEAAATGLELYITRKNVGATELLEDMEMVHIVDSPEDLILNDGIIIDMNDKQSLRNRRLERLSRYDWEASGKAFYELLKEA